MLKNRLDISLENEHFVLCKEKVVFWKNEDALLLSDVHAGKAAHFRKYGLPLSSDHLLRDLNKIDILIEEFNPKSVYFLGDLFHSDFNEENELIEAWVKEKTQNCLLVAGNHDVHSLNAIRMPMLSDLTIRKVLLSHEPIAESSELNICGHLHPGFSISGPGRQRFQLPAFYISNSHIILPAFGSLTGKRSYKNWIAQSDVFAITDEGIIAAASLAT